MTVYKIEILLDSLNSIEIPNDYHNKLREVNGNIPIWGFPGGSDGKESACNAGDPGSIPLLGRKWQPTVVFLPGKYHGQRSLAGYSPWGHKESYMTD